jgi:putative membrane protein
MSPRIKDKSHSAFRISHLLAGGLCGFAAGIGASAAMDAYWAIVRDKPGERPEQKPRAGDRKRNDDPSTQEIAHAISKAVTGHKVPADKKAVAGVAVHYGFGALCGALYGMLAALRPATGLLSGLVYGIAIWLFSDEIGLRAMGVAPDARKVPVRQHVQAFGAHLVYGAGTALLSKLLLRLLR